MYDYDYEVDILLTLRLLKYLYQQDPKALADVLKAFKTCQEDELFVLQEDTIWEIFSNVRFDQNDDWDAATVTLSHPVIDRCCRLHQRLQEVRGYRTDAWEQKVRDVVEFYICATSYSVCDLSSSFFGGSFFIQIQLSPDCYEPGNLGNSFVDMLLYFQRENLRLERLLTQETSQGKEAA